MPKRSSKDENQLAKAVIDDIILETEGNPSLINGKNAAAVYLGRMGGKIGGRVRAAKLSPERRKEIARKAAQTRWEKKTSKE